MSFLLHLHNLDEAAALFDAARDKCFDGVRRAVTRRGFHVDTQDAVGCTLLHWAVHARSVGGVRGRRALPPSLFLLCMWL
jgi:ankyrin repeat protein